MCRKQIAEHRDHSDGGSIGTELDRIHPLIERGPSNHPTDTPTERGNDQQ